MKRKLIQLSTSTKVISLPSPWLKKNNLQKGAELNVNEKDNLLIISKEKDASSKKITLNITNLDDGLVRMIVDTAYMQGYQEMLFETNGREQMNLLGKVVSFFPGLIIYEEKNKSVILKNIAVQEEFDLSQLISRIRNMTLSIIDESINAIKSKDWEILIKSKKRDYVINTYVSMAFRHLNTYGYSPESKHSAIAQHVKLLEIFSDRLCILLKKIGEKEENNKTQIEILSSIRDLYRDESFLIIKFNLQRLLEFDDKRLKLLTKSKNIDKNLQTDLTELVQIFFEIEEVATQLNI